MIEFAVAVVAAAVVIAIWEAAKPKPKGGYRLPDPGPDGLYHVYEDPDGVWRIVVETRPGYEPLARTKPLGTFVAESWAPVPGHSLLEILEREGYRPPDDPRAN